MTLEYREFAMKSSIRTMICHRMGNDASDKSRSYGTLMSADNIRILDNDKLPSIISLSPLVHLHAPRYRPETGVQLKDPINDKHLGPLISPLWLVIYRGLNDELQRDGVFHFLTGKCLIPSRLG